MTSPCYSAEVARALQSVTLVWWACWALLALLAVAFVITDRARS